MANLKTKTLTPAKKKFAQEFARTDNGSEAVRRAFKDKPLTELTIRNKAHRLLTNANVQKEIAIQKAQLQKLATKAIYRLDSLIDSEDETVAGMNSRYVIDRTHGKLDAQQGTHIESITINLGTLPATDKPDSQNIIDIPSQ